jgi:hypothetical protein
MQPQTPPTTLEYASPSPSARTPKLWVFLVLAVVHLFGIGCGFHVWYYLDQPGKDPLAQLYQCGPIGLAIAAGLYSLYFRRSWRLTMAAVVVSFALGASTGLAAVVWHIQQLGWH